MPELTEERYFELKEEVDNLSSEYERAQGQLDALTKRLEEEYGCKDLKAAKTLLKKKRKEKEDLDKKFRESLEAYEQNWKRDDEEND